MPAVCNLDGVRQGLCGSTRIRPAAVASDDGDLRLGGKPCLSRCGFSIREQAGRFSPFQIADDRAVSMISPPRPVINTDNVRRRACRASAPTYHPQQSVVADREPQSLGKARGRPTSQRKCEMVYKAVEATRTPRPRCHHPSSELLGEDLLSTLLRGTSKAANITDQMYRFPRQWQIGDTALIATMNPPAFLSARGQQLDRQVLRTVMVVRSSSLDAATIVKPAGMRDEGWSALFMTMIPSGAAAVRPQNCIKIESEPLFHADPQR